MTEKSIAHKHDMNWVGQQHWPDNMPEWTPATPADVMAGRTTSRLRACGYCGSMHPADVAAAIKAGAKGHFADWKYGWPHKVYLDNVPNPHAGVLESRSYHSNPPQEEIDAGKWIKVPTSYFNRETGEKEYHWVNKPTPVGKLTHGKFYTVHLQDATPEDKAVIEKHLGLKFEFLNDGRGIEWSKA